MKIKPFAGSNLAKGFSLYLCITFCNYFCVACYTKNMKKILFVFLSSFVLLFTVSGVYNFFQNSDLINQGQQVAAVPVVKSPLGGLTVINAGLITGWACDGDSYSTALDIKLYKDATIERGGVLVGTYPANVNRPDLSRYCGNTANHGYSIPIPDSLKDGKTHPIYAYAVNIGATGVDKLLTGSPKNVINQTPVGIFESLVNGVATGWVTDPDTSTSPINVVLFMDTPKTVGVAPLATTSANLPHADVTVAKVKYSGNYGFTYTLPAQYKDGKRHTLYAYGVDAQTGVYKALTGSPKVFTLATSVNFSISIPARNISVSRITSNDATLSWPRVAGAAGYGVYFDDYLLDTTTSTTYNTGGILMPDTEYEVKILPLENLNQAKQLLVFESKTQGFWARVWSGMLAAIGATTQPAQDEIKKFGTRAEPPISVLAGPNRPLKILAIMLDYANSYPTAKDSVASVKENLSGSGMSVEKYYKEVSYNKFNVTGDVVNVGIPKSFAFVDRQTGITEISGLKVGKFANRMYLSANQTAFSTLLLEGKKFDDYKVIIYVWPRLSGSANGVSDGIGTSDTLNGVVGGEIKGRIWINGIQPASVYAHELGHKLGLFHADGFECSSLPKAPESSLDYDSYEGAGFYPLSFDWWDECKIHDYIDPINLMGNMSFGHFSSFQKNLLGWVSRRNIVTTGVYNVIPAEEPTTEALVVGSPSPGASVTTVNSFYLDYRKPKGFDIGLPRDYYEGVSIEIPGRIRNPGIENTLIIRKWANANNGSDAIVSPYVIHDREFFYTPLTYKSVGSGSSMARVPDSGVKVIQLSHNDTAAKVYVRFDAKPINVSVSIPSPTTRTINWKWSDTVLPIGGYEVYRGNIATSSLVTTISNPSTTTFTDTGRTSGTSYTYFVRGFDTFSEVPGKKFFMPFSEPTVSKVPVPIADIFSGVNGLDGVDVGGNLICYKALLYTDNSVTGDYPPSSRCKVRSIRITNDQYTVTFAYPIGMYSDLRSRYPNANVVGNAVVFGGGGLFDVLPGYTSWVVNDASSTNPVVPVSTVVPVVNIHSTSVLDACGNFTINSDSTVTNASGVSMSSSCIIDSFELINTNFTFTLHYPPAFWLLPFSAPDYVISAEASTLTVGKRKVYVPEKHIGVGYVFWSINVK